MKEFSNDKIIFNVEKKLDLLVEGYKVFEKSYTMCQMQGIPNKENLRSMFNMRNAYEEVFERYKELVKSTIPNQNFSELKSYFVRYGEQDSHSKKKSLKYLINLKNKKEILN